MKIYIAGKITDDFGYKQKFASYTRAVEGEGYTVMNPAVLPAGMASADYMRICFAMIDSADVVAFLPDWKDSPGARLEQDYCCYVGKHIEYL